MHTTSANIFPLSRERNAVSNLANIVHTLDSVSLSIYFAFSRNYARGSITFGLYLGGLHLLFYQCAI